MDKQESPQTMQLFGLTRPQVLRLRRSLGELPYDKVMDLMLELESLPVLNVTQDQNAKPDG